jgi:tripartite-type tricarboxylate transporter receptor subunit TctC
MGLDPGMAKGEQEGIHQLGARRMRVQRWGVLAAAGVAVASASMPPALAQDYPTRSVRIVVPFPPGGTADAMPRIIGDWLARKWGQAVVIENKAGAGGNVGAEVVANAEPDGYTLLSSPPPPLVINQNLYPKLGFDPLAFVPISVMAIVPNALVVNPAKITANTVPQFITLARANPGKITSATQGNGTTSHLTSAMFQMLANVQFVNVPYRGSGPALQGLVAGDVDIMFDNLGVSLALVQGGQLKLIAVGTERRMTSLPEIPTIAETLPGFVSSAWFAVVAPPKTPQAIAAKINADIGDALRQPDIAKRLADLSAEPVGGTTVAAARFMSQEVERWRGVIKATGIKLE